jgi:hypothetical protein
VENHYAKNSQALAKRSPELAQFLSTLASSEYHLQPTPSQEPSLAIQTKDGQILHMDASQDPRASAREFLPPAGAHKKLFVVLGMGLGYLFLEAAKRFPDCKFLVIESDANIFKKALEAFDFTPYLASDRFEFLVGIAQSHLLLSFKDFFTKDDNHVYQPTVEVIQHRHNMSLAAAYYKNAVALFGQSMQDFWNTVVGNDYRDPLMGLEHTLANLRFLKTMASLEHFRGVYKDHVGILVSSGPSLDSKMEFLKKYQDRAVIVCADSGLKKLLEYGITPFAVSSLERTDSIQKLYEGYDKPDDVHMIAPPLLYTEVFELGPRKKISSFRNCYPFAWMPPVMPTLDLGLSCAHQSFAILNLLGCKEIGFVGQDLAYHRATGTAHYAGMYQFNKEVLENLDNKIAVEDNQGTTITTNEFWVVFRNIFTNMIATFGHKSVYNVIEKDFGLKIPGTTRRDPEEFFKCLDNAPKIPKLNWEDGNNALNRKLPGFYRELRHVIDDSLKQLKILHTEIPGFAKVQNYDEYIAHRNAMLGKLDAKTRYLWFELIKPYTVRFEANAFSLFNEKEFLENRVGLAESLKRILDPLEDVLRDGRPSETEFPGP